MRSSHDYLTILTSPALLFSNADLGGYGRNRTGVPGWLYACIVHIMLHTHKNVSLFLTVISLS